MAYDKKNMDKDSDESRALLNIVESHIDDSLGFIETETSQERQTALEYYLREPYGNEVEGRSQIVTGEVAEVVDGALPQIMKVFTTSSKAVEFEPVNVGDGAIAEQVTAYVNHIFYKDNNGFELMHDWFKDGLLQKVGVLKAYWDDKKNTTKEKYENLTEDELAMIMQDEEVEIVEQEEVEEETNDEFEHLYKGQISKSGVAILPSKRTRRIPEVKTKVPESNLAKEALSELKSEQPEITEENLDKEEEPLELSEEATEEENKS